MIVSEGQVSGQITPGGQLDGLVTKPSEIQASVNTSEGQISAEISSEGTVRGVIGRKKNMQGGINFPSGFASIRELLDQKVDKVDGKELSTNDFTDEDKQKLDSLSVNHEAFSYVVANGAVIEADAQKDTLRLVRGRNINFRVDPDEKSITIDSYEYPEATGQNAGLMSAEDKSKLDSIAQSSEQNQNAFSNIAVSGSDTISADEKTDTITFEAGDHVTITPDTANDKITIDASFETLTEREVAEGTGTEGKLVSAKALHSIGGAPNGFATLDENGIIYTGQLPTWVDDVQEVYVESGAEELSESWFSTTHPESGKLYVLMETTEHYPANSLFRWNGTQYVPVVTSNNGGSYLPLYDKPRIESVTLVGNQSFEDLGLERISSAELIYLLGD